MSNFLLCSNTVYWLSVRVCLCGYVYMCVGLYVHVHACESRCQKLMSAVSLNHVFTSCFTLRHRVSLNPELINFGQSGWPMSSRDPSTSVLTSSTGVTEELPHVWMLPRWGLISSHHACMEDLLLAEPLMTPVLYEHLLILFHRENTSFLHVQTYGLSGCSIWSCYNLETL